MNTDYFQELSGHLRAQGVAQDRITTTVADLTGYAQESGVDPAEEFGPADEFARTLAAGEDGALGPEPGAHTWRWTADAYTEQDLMNRFGAQGWEIDRVDWLGRFVSHRDPEDPQRWEYRRDVVNRRDRSRHAAALAPDGWEPCGHWMFLAYSKRPLAVTSGPAARLAQPPRRPARSVYYSRRFYGLLTMVAVSWGLLALALLLPDDVLGGNSGFRDGLSYGLLAGAALGSLAAVWVVRRLRDELRQDSRFPPPDLSSAPR